jgi:serine/threonine protein kinase
MDQRQWEQVEAHFAEIADLTPQQQEAYLSRLSGMNAWLRDELASLLRAHQERSTFLECEPELIGPYRVLQEIGRGGMGTVYRAERADGQFQQQVAIKVVRPLGPAILYRRLAEERQILANLSHPYIARLLDGGITHTGQPFLVMELVEGLPLVDYCRRKDRQAILRLFRHICSAVSYAHQNLVVHRDLKPANILVTRDGVPKLLDFGIAKILSPASGGGVTIQPAMTPDYASPEQIRGEPLTTASDIYSLGVLLQEVLSGRRPHSFAGKPPFEIIRQISEQPPEKPATGSADLDAIIAKALSSDPVRRYPSAEALSADIGHFLGHRPVEARQRNPIYILTRFVDRHRITVAVSLLFGLALAIAGAITIRQSRISQRRFEVVRHLASSTIFQIHDSVAALPGSTASRKLIVANALDALDRLAADAGDDPALKFELAQAYLRLGDVQGNPTKANLGDSEAALFSYGKARNLLEELRRGGDSSQPTGLALVRAEISTASVLGVRRKTAEAVRHASRAVSLAESLRNRFPGDEAERQLASAYSSLADVSRNNEEARIKALTLFDALLARNPGDPDRQRNVALASKYLASVYLDTGVPDKALPLLRRAESLDRARSNANPSNREAALDLSFDHSMIGYQYLRQGRLDLTHANYAEALRIRKKLLAEDPSDARMKDRVVYMLIRVASALNKLGRHEQALRSGQEALLLIESLSAIDRANPHYMVQLATTHHSIAESALGARRTDVGCASLRTALGMYGSLDGKGQLASGEQADFKLARKLAANCPGPL